MKKHFESQTTTIVDLVSAIEGYLVAEQNFADDGAPEYFNAYVEAGDHLRDILENAKRSAA